MLTFLFIKVVLFFVFKPSPLAVAVKGKQVAFPVLMVKVKCPSKSPKKDENKLIIEFSIELRNRT